MTNEERFLASCEEVGETDVRDKLSAGRYGERKTLWASTWLEKVESGKSDATKAAESSNLLRKGTGADRYSAYTTPAIIIVLLLTGAAAFLIIVR